MLYENAQVAHDEIFLSEPEDSEVIARFQKFETDFNQDKSHVFVDLSFLRGLSRILLIREIILCIVDIADRSGEQTITYKFGKSLFKCDHVVTKGFPVIFHPANLHLHGIGKYAEIKLELERISSLSSPKKIASKIRASRKTGTPIRPFDDLDEGDADFLNRFVLLQDLEVVRRLYRERDKDGERLTEPSNPHDSLPVGVAIAAASHLMRHHSRYHFDNTNLFNAVADENSWDRSVSYGNWIEESARKRGLVIKGIIHKLGPDWWTVGRIKLLIRKEFGR